MSPVPAFTVATLDELLPVTQVADPALEPWLGCESTHSMFGIPDFADAHAHGDLSRTRRPDAGFQFAG